MTNLLKYERIRDLVIAVVLTLTFTTTAYQTGYLKGKVEAGESCDALRAERTEKYLKQLQLNGVQNALPKEGI